MAATAAPEPSTTVPELTLRLFDSATRTTRPLFVRSPGQVSVYTCGPTVYDLPHLGHGRSMVTYDVLRRYLSFRGLEVTFVSNITDVDDKILNRADKEGRPFLEVARQYEEAWNDALDALSVLRPDHAPRATEYVEEMVEVVTRLVESGRAYVTERGVVLDTASVEGYGLLAHQDLGELRGGVRVEVDAQKRNFTDFVLWKPAGQDEVGWDSPLGRGRPGWHTECVAMSLKLLGEGFDLHTGGMDLLFPHHENERAQAVALGAEFAGHWMHHAFVEVNSVKMGKSLGNFTTLTDLLAKNDPRSLRLLLLQSHYRSPVEVTPATLAEAASALERFENLVRRAPSTSDPDETVLDAFVQAMDDDLDTPRALAGLFDAVRSANTLLDTGGDAAALTAAILTCLAALGVDLTGGDARLDEGAEELVAQRDTARARKDWGTSDRLRVELQGMGYTVEDTPGGTRIFR